MTSRAMSELLLVGSLPAESADTALRAGSELIGDMVFALPDGETGPRAAWVGYEREQLGGQTPTWRSCGRRSRRPVSRDMLMRHRYSESAMG